jgi:hypothetical protein
MLNPQHDASRNGDSEKAERASAIEAEAEAFPIGPLNLVILYPGLIMTTWV